MSPGWGMSRVSSEPDSSRRYACRQRVDCGHGRWGRRTSASRTDPHVCSWRV